jgi:DNA-directed RNA polymerase specialized sigma24 family protein
MALTLASQIVEWAMSDLEAFAMELARKCNCEDALQDTLTEWLKKGGGQPSPYPDIRALHAVLLRAIRNRQKDIHRRDSSRRRWEDKSIATRRPAQTSDPIAEEERRTQERRQEVARILSLEMVERLEPLEQIAILIDQNISGYNFIPDMSSSNQTLAFDPEMLGWIQAAAARLEPPVSEREVCTWRHLEDVARSLGLPSATLRAKRHRAYPKLQRFLEDRGVLFEHWNEFALDD